MLDTNSVNLAFSKMEGIVSRMVPHMQNISEQFIKYSVAKQYLAMVYSTCLFAIFGVIFGIFYNFLEKEKEDNVFYIVGLLVSGLIVLISLLCIIFNVEPTILAFINPEFFTIEKVIEAYSATK
jgi:hypothetical protein